MGDSPWSEDISPGRIIAPHDRFILNVGAQIIWRAGPDAKPIARAALCAAPVAPLARIHLDRSLDTRLWHRRHDSHLLYRGRRPAAALAILRSVQAGGAGGYR